MSEAAMVEAQHGPFRVGASLGPSARGSARFARSGPDPAACGPRGFARKAPAENESFPDARGETA